MTTSRQQLFRLALVGLAAALLLGLFGRIMAYPLGHDEQGHIAAARLIFDAPLYRVLGYNHFPGLPLLLGGLYALTGTDHLLLVGRLLVFVCWLATGGVLWVMARRRASAAVFAWLSLAGAGLLDPAGMLVTNNFLPVPFALLGFHLFVIGLEHSRPSALRLFAAGLCAGLAVILKVAFAFLVPCFALAALFARSDLPPGGRLRAVALPFAAGGLLGGAPLLAVLATEPQSLLAHTVRYFTGPHLAYWRQADGPKAMSLPDKVVVAEQVWLGGACALAAFLACRFALALWSDRTRRLHRMWWPAILATALVVSGAALSFLPTPAFPQYYLPPVPFLVAAVILLHGELTGEGARRAEPVLWIAAAICLAIVSPRLLAGIPGALRPDRWTGVAVHQEAGRLREALARSRGPVATLSPILPLEGGLPIYPQFAAGPFVYRVAPFIPARDRQWFLATSERELPALLDSRPPVAVVTGFEPELDAAFVRYARQRGYAPTALRAGGATAFLPAAGRRAPLRAGGPVS